MPIAPSNLEIVARDICARQITHSCETPDELRLSVDRYWHIVAAQLDAGIIDESGRDLEPFDNNRRLAAVRDWRARHPHHKVPPSRLDLTPTLVRGLGNFSGVLSLLGERPRGQVPQ
jgi:hypothetical protein